MRATVRELTVARSQRINSPGFGAWAVARHGGSETYGSRGSVTRGILKIAVVALALTLCVGCITVTTGADLAVRRQAMFVNVDTTIYNGDTKNFVGFSARVRGGVPTFFDVGAGLVGCKLVEPARLNLCANGMLLELGVLDGQFQLGMLSPSIYVDYLGKSPFKNRDSPRMLSLRLGVGYDVRPLRGFSETRPYMFVGGGFML